MKQQYKVISFQKKTLELIELCNNIMDEYVGKGYRLTVRMLYYQLVARGHIENTIQSYKRTTAMCNDARMAGLMDWEAIEDRTREFIRRSHWEKGEDLLEAVAQQYHMDMWVGQDHRVFVVVEKEALVGVLERTCHDLDVPLLAARGYPSATVLREFALSDIFACIEAGQSPVLLHLGDHDPSGIDMTRDLEERLALFVESKAIALDRIALNMDQIKKYNPPPNPAKETDKRFKAYRKKFGKQSWELDALSPEVLTGLVRKHTEQYIDTKIWKARKGEINDIKDRLNDARSWYIEQLEE